MYEQHFGFKRPPFRSVTTGAAVFLGPQTAQTIKAVRKAMATQDAVITVSGPVGVGKTTVVGRSLDALGGKQTRIRIGRMSIAHDEILDFLLDVLGVKEKPASTIRRIALFRAILAQKTQGGERVIVIVEDGARLGEDPLAELEALTAADGGAGGGAAVVIMGDPGLRAALDKPSLDRLNQRMRLRHQLKPLNEGELTGYLKHCFRLAGGEFDIIFDAQAPAALCRLSGGIPRVCNNLVDSTLTAAAEQSLKKIGVDLLNRVAGEQYGLTVNSTSADVSQISEALKPPSADPSGDQRANIQISQTQSMPALDEDAVLSSEEAPTPAADEPRAETTARADAPVPDDNPADTGRAAPVEPEIAPVETTARDETPEPEFEIPELIQDTMPELAVLPSNLADAAASGADIPTLEWQEDTSAAAAKPEAPARTDDTPAEPPPLEPPTVSAAEAPVASEPAADPAAASVEEDETPAWDRDPTLAELRPDLEALESALAEATGASEEKAPPAADAPEIEIALKDPTLPGVPELRLEESIQQSIDEATAALEKHDSTIAEGEAGQKLANAAPSTAKADAELEKIAQGLARAKTLDDVDDKMAETLFGEEFSLIAAQVAANCANIDTDDEDPGAGADLELAAEPDAAVPSESAAAVPPASPAPTAAQAAASPSANATGAAATSPTARMRTVQALNAAKDGRPPSVAHMAGDKPAAPAARKTSAPPTIETQFAGGITSTRIPKPSELSTVTDDDDDEDEEEVSKKSGFFSRFKR